MKSPSSSVILGRELSPVLLSEQFIGNVADIVHTSTVISFNDRSNAFNRSNASAILRHDAAALADWAPVFEILTPDYLEQGKKTFEEFVRAFLLPKAGLIKNIVLSEISANRHDPSAQKFNLYTTAALERDLKPLLESYYGRLQHPHNAIDLTKLETDITRLINSAGRHQSVAVITRQKRFDRIVRKFAQARYEGACPTDVIDALFGEYVPNVSIDINAGMVLTADSCGQPDRIAKQIISKCNELNKRYENNDILRVSRPLEFVNKPDHTSRKFGATYRYTPISLRVNNTEEFLRTERTHKAYELRQALAFKRSEKKTDIPTSRVYDAFMSYAC